MNRRPILILSLMLLAGVVWASGCGEDTTEPTPPPEPPRATAITVAPATTELTALGATAQLSAEVRDQNGQVIAGATVTWASSSPEVAAVDAAGLVTAASNGAATITASAGTASGSAAVTVAQEASALVVSPAADKVPVGDTVRLEAEVRDANDHALAGDASVTWSSSDPSVATVDGSGLVSGVALGTATITAVSASLQGTAQVTVAAVADVERDALVALYESTGGDDWDINRGWLSGGPLSAWHGVETNSDGQVVELYLFDNSLSGSLPPEIGNLTELRTLTLLLNDLSGSLPPEIGDLTELRQLWLQANDLSGSIPPELGNLSNLVLLGLSNNAFTGPIPAELGNLANMQALYAQENALSGEIPAELGNLSQLTDMWLSGNDLSGPFPVGLTRLANLKRLALDGNPLTGALPEEIGDMASLESLLLATSGLSGLLPAGMTRLQRLEELMLAGTGLCAPDDDDFQAWLDGVLKRRIPSCEDPGDGSAAHLTQAVQSRAYPVPLVAGEKALLRVFVVAPAAEGDTIPLVRATFYLDGQVEEVVEIEPGSSLIGDEVNEGSLEASANAEVPASVIQPGLEVVVEIDPDGTMDPELGVMQRIPETGRAAVEVRQMPDLEFTLIPFLWDTDPDSAILEITEDLSADDELLGTINELLPVEDVDLKIHDPVVSTSNYSEDLLDRTDAIRVAESGTGYFMGTMSGRVTGGDGIAYAPGWTSFSIPDPTVMAHELGHNLSLLHAPCGGAFDPDPSFPQPDGTIGAWGYNFDSGELVRPSIYELMSYCDPSWISEFYFTNSLRYRVVVETEGDLARRAAPARSLLIWGGADPDGVPHLEPVFVIDARPSLPRAGGVYRLSGTTEDGAELFGLNFDMPVVADAEGRGSFAFALPVQPGWETNLARIALSGPDGSFTLDTDSDSPGAIVRDPRTGQVRGILTGLPRGSTAADVLAGHDFEPGFELFFSRGIPEAAAWRR